jgi:hypothetical protein
MINPVQLICLFSQHLVQVQKENGQSDNTNKSKAAHPSLKQLLAQKKSSLENIHIQTY